jgi:hypothetical protein
MGPGLERLTVELAAQVRHGLYGKYRGIVKDVNDPEGLGRIKAEVKDVLAGFDSCWATPCLPFAGDGEGQFTIPPVGAGVWIEFEAGDASRPIWTGCWWGKGQPPKDETGTDASPTLKVLRTTQGLLLAMDDDNKAIALSDDSGANFLKIKVNEGQITVQATTKVVVEAPQIELVEGAPHPLVFGDDLLQYLNQLVSLFNAHLHPGETVLGIPVTPAPPVAPFPPATPALLSMKVKTG